MFCSFQFTKFELSLNVSINLFYSFWWSGIFLFSCLDWCSLLVYINDFCILLLYPEMLLNLFISSLSFTSGFLLYKIISSMNANSFVSFQIWMTYISFSCLIALVRTTNTTLSGSGDSGTLILFLILGRKHSVFHHWV